MQEDRLPPRVTIRQVAENAGVSVSAVSKVLRDAYGVSASLRARVEASIRELNYRPLAAARGMRGRTYTLGLVLPDIRNPFFAEILDGVASALAETQYQVMIGITEPAASEDAVIEAMIDRQVEGIILVGTVNVEAVVDALASRLPLVALGFHAPTMRTFDTVNTDDQLGARLAVRHLVANGFLATTMFSLDRPESTIIAQRELGYRREMIRCGLSEHINIVRVGSAKAQIVAGAKRVLDEPVRPRALFCWSDLVAVEVLSVASDMGLTSPNDVAIVGYDNSPVCALAQNGLTSVNQPGAVLGQSAARLLLERVGGRVSAQHIILQPKLIMRASSAAVSTCG
ncbi:LacI family DNA-binding transcriptional regulator [Devosia sp. UYZn731]|uniref:LacI family DNA-binding transcriptional regulator n=1 Tax=Devosia sp. UYZn731 TaxID=3156345 RepID=UPI00339B4B0C